MNNLIVVIGRSGCGKTTMCDLLEERRGIKQIRTYTTKAPRDKYDNSHKFSNYTQYVFAKSFCNIISETQWLDENKDEMVYYWTIDNQIEQGEPQTLVVDNSGLKMIREFKIPHTSIYIISDQDKRYRNLMGNTEKLDYIEYRSKRDKVLARMNRDKDFEIVSADYTIDGNCTIEELYERVCSVIDGKE